MRTRVRLAVRKARLWCSYAIRRTRARAWKATTALMDVRLQRVLEVVAKTGELLAPAVTQQLERAYGPDWLRQVNERRTANGKPPGRGTHDHRFVLALISHEPALAGTFTDDERRVARLLNHIANDAFHNDMRAGYDDAETEKLAARLTQRTELAQSKAQRADWAAPCWETRNRPGRREIHQAALEQPTTLITSQIPLLLFGFEGRREGQPHGRPARPPGARARRSPPHQPEVPERQPVVLPDAPPSAKRRAAPAPMNPTRASARGGRPVGGCQASRRSRLGRRGAGRSGRTALRPPGL
jgi:hypothetical protein